MRKTMLGFAAAAAGLAAFDVVFRGETAAGAFESENRLFVAGAAGSGGRAAGDRLFPICLGLNP